MKFRWIAILVCVYGVTPLFSLAGEPPEDRHYGFAFTDAYHALTKSEKGCCIVYERYVITTEAGKDAGETTRVYPVSPKAVHKDLCDSVTQSEPCLKVDNKWAAYFSGIKNDWLFIDAGTGPDIRTLSVFALKTGNLIFEGPYVDDNTMRFVPPGKLSFYQAGETVKNKDECPNDVSRFWPAVRMNKQVILDMNSGKLEPTGKKTCAYDM